MRTWFKHWKHGRELDIEAELKASRPAPSRHLVKAIADRVSPRPVPIRSARSRIAFAGVATAAMVAAIGASGGFSYAASSLSTAAKATAHAVHFDAGPNLPGSHDAGPGGTSAGAQYLGVPTITKLSATAGVVGSSVTVTGTNLGGITDMTVAGIEIDLSTIVNSSTNAVVFKVPDNGGSSAVGPVTVTNPAGTASFGSFTLIAAPHITSLAVSAGTLTTLKPGQHLLITGTNFRGVNIPPGSVTIAGKPVKTFVVTGDTSIDATVPTGLSSTTLGNVVVKNAAGSATSAQQVEGAPGPTISSLGKTSGLVGDVLQINGTNFDSTIDTVTINGDAAANANLSSWTATKAFVTVPTPTALNATGPVVITDGSGGNGVSAKNFTTIVAPAISGFAPSPGTGVGGTVTLTGHHFMGTSSVHFTGAAKPSAFKVGSDSSLTTVVPKDATSGAISVTNAAGSDNSNTSGFTVLLAPTIDPTGVTANNPSIAGDTVTITGSNFVNTSTVHIQVFFGKVSAVGTPSNAGHTLTVTVPVGATSGKPKVVEAGGSATAAQSVTMVGGPTVSSIPANQVANGTQSITIKGKGFLGTDGGASTTVQFGSGTTVAHGSFTAFTDTAITLVVPAGAEIGPITVSANTGDGLSKSSFVPIKTPTPVSFWPSQGQKVGGTLTIAGTHLSGSTLVTFQGATFNTAKPKVLSDGILTVIVPKGATGGTITVTNAAGTSAPSLGGFVILQPPTITSMSVSSGTLTINGTNFEDTDDLVVTVKIGAAVCTNVTVVNPTKVTCTVPGSVVGKKASVALTEEAGKAMSAPFQF